MTIQVFSWLLGLGGAYGMWLAGRRSAAGWAIGLALQPIWFAFNIMVHAWGLVFTPFLYGFVYARNLARWRKESQT